ncbi:MAG: hypothetical protein KIT58_03095 [Planctomycetota bacterium]|nr:hypothetical protein [Planctomycetota bacterium]
MSKHEIPSFACEETHEVTVAGRALRFFAVSGMTLLRLQQRLGGPFAKVVDTLLSGDGGAEARRAALAELLEEVGRHSTLVGELVLDALHDEPWNKRPAKPDDVQAFLSCCSGPALAAMLAAVAAVNARAFLPLAQGLLADLRTSAQSLAGSPSDPSQESAPAA